MKNFKIYLIVFYIIIFGMSFGGRAFADEGGEINIPDIYINAINPGYTVDGKTNVGEMVEIGFKKENPDDMILLAGLAISYTNSSGNTSMLVEFPEHSYVTGEKILLRLASTEDAELANVVYTKTLAFQGGLTLLKNNEVVDEVCWTGKGDCKKAFKSSSPTVLKRNLETGEFEHVESYEPEYYAEAYHAGEEENENDETNEVQPQCVGLKFSEILSYYAESKSEQFVEVYNSSSEQILLDGCFIKYKNKLYSLDGIIKPEEYKARFATDFSLTKNPNNYNLLELIDVNGAVVDSLKYPNGQRKGTAYAFIGYDEKGEEIWRTTYAVTPGEPNNYQEYKTCEEGKVINEATGNCVKVAVVTEKVCPEGQYLNILTGRCKKVETEKATTCKEGYEINPETGRCKKIKNNDGTTYSLREDEFEEKESFVAVYAIIGVVVAGLIYVIYEFRHEIVKFLRKVYRRFRQKLHRGTGRH